MDKPRNAGRVSCRVCLEDFQCTINYLSEAVDVYNEWIDACESANWWTYFENFGKHSPFTFDVPQAEIV